MNFFTITNILLWPFFLGYGLEKCIHKQLTDVTAICIAPKLATTAKYSKQNFLKKNPHTSEVWKYRKNFHINKYHWYT